MVDSWNEVKSWMDSCELNHKECRVTTTDPALPTRVIDVGRDSDSNVSLVDTHGEPGKYAYLTYAQGVKKRFPQTTIVNPDAIREWGLVVNMLPLNFREAIQTTRALGLRYLWIDALCIIQDSREDWGHEFGKTQHYLRNALLVINAAASSHANAGLFTKRQPPLLHMELTWTPGVPNKNDQHSVSLFLRRPLLTASEALGERVLTRGWMLYEVVLSTRILIVGSDQLYWHCRSCSKSEGSTLVLEPFIKLLPRTQAGILGTHSPHRTYRPWYNVIATYSAAQFRYDNDKPMVIGAIADYFDHNMESSYTAGLWVEDFHSGILWYVDDNISHEFEILGRRNLAPSWSWLAISRGIRYDLLVGARHELVPAENSFTMLHVHDFGSPGESRLHRDGTNDLYHAVLELSPSIDLKTCLCLFDQVDLEQTWRSMSAKLTFMFVCPWSLSLPDDMSQASSLGLILQLQEDRNVVERYGIAYKRVGLFLMSKYDESMTGWTRRQIIIV